MNLSEMQNEEFVKIVYEGINDLSDLFHKIMYSKKILDLNDDKSIHSLIYMLNSFVVNNIIEIAGKATFIENATGKHINRKERMVIVSEEFIRLQKDMFKSVIDYQMEIFNERK